MIEKTWEFILKVAKDPYPNNPVRILIEILLLGLVIRYAFRNSTHSNSNEIVLKVEEAEQVIKEWEPKRIEGLEEDAVDVDTQKNKIVLSQYNPFLFNSTAGPIPGLPGETKESREEKKKELQGIIDKYGVGTCGPRGFYGTLDLQLSLEQELAKSLGVQGVVLYAHALLAVASVIKCFCKRTDVIFYDYRSSVSIRRGIYASKSKAIPYTSVIDLDAKLSLEKAHRKFIITEGIFEETGETADIGQVVKAKRMHKAFLILDESVSIPMLGSKGCMGFFGVNPEEIDLWVGSLAGGYGSAGGFCGGTKEITEQQRLSSLAYCFSASLPAFLTYHAQRNLKDVIRWEEEHESVLRQETEEDSVSETEFVHTPEIEFPIKSPTRSPKFAFRFKRDKNTLINLEGVEKFVRKFNKKARNEFIPFRCKNDQYTSIVRIITQEEEKEALITQANAILHKNQIYLRQSPYPDPCLLLTIDNSFSPMQSEKLASQILSLIKEAAISQMDER
ncbi:serine palmitoyltransferase [Nematocida sp. AWRm80]|nr:serine palmitoyltransferase [Nematocida sp. AWRm80]